MLPGMETPSGEQRHRHEGCDLLALDYRLLPTPIAQQTPSL